MNKTFDDVRLKVTFTPASSRSNISSGENIATSLGKISKWYSSFHNVAWTGNADKVSGFTVGVNVPSTAKFTDVSVKQSLSNASNFRPIVLGYTDSSDSSTLGDTATGQVYVTPNIYAKASTGDIYANSFIGSGSSLTNINPDNLSKVVPIIKGGTGATTPKVARDNLLGDISESTTAITDTNQIVFKFADENKGVLLYKQASTLWDYFKGKADDVYAASSHGTHVSFSTTVPKANGTAAVGTATTVSRSDHIHPLQTTVSGNAGTATKLKTAVNIDGISFDGSTDIKHYATCSTAAATVAKVATLNTGTLTLSTGVTVYVKFTNANTATAATLNVGGTGAKPIFHNGAAISASSYIKAGGVYQFVYDGTNWVINAGIDTNTTYSVMTGATADAAGTKGLVPAPTAGKQTSFLRGDGTWVVPTNTDTKVNVTLATTTKAYLLGVSTAPTSTAKALTAVSDTGVYLDTTAGKLTATSFAGSGASLTSLNASNISNGTLSADRLATSGATAGSYGPSANASPTHSGTFSVPYITIDAKGRVTSASTKTITLPASGNTDVSVKQSLTETSNYRPLLLGLNNTTDPSTLTDEASTGQTYMSPNLYVKPVSGDLYARKLHAEYSLHFKDFDTGEEYAALYHNESNLWLGAERSNGVHHTGGTYISTGYDSTNSKGFDTIYVGIPNETNTNASLYKVFHEGNYMNFNGHLRQTVMNQPSASASSTPWFKIASYTTKTASDHAFITMAISSGMVATQVGILHVKIATSSTVGTNSSCTARWISSASGIDPSDFIVTYTETSGTSITYEIWCKLNQQWRTFVISVINEGTRTSYGQKWTLSENTTTGSSTYGTPTAAVESIYSTIPNPIKTEGEIEAVTFIGSGASLTSLNASNLSSGTVPIARIPTGTTSTTVALGNHTHSNYYSSSTTRTANTVLAAPNGSDGTASFRKLVAADLPTSGATAASYGPSANATPAHGGTFSVPYVTVDKYGRITAASTKTITLPASGNTDTKVNVTLAKTTKAYVLGVSTTPTSTAQALSAVSDTGVYLDTTAGRLTATSFEAPGSNRSVVITGSGVRNVTPADTGWAMGMTWYTSDASATIASMGVYGKAGATTADDIYHMYMGPNYDDPWFKISPTLATFTKDVTITKQTPTLTLYGENSTSPTLVLKRPASSWQILNASGAFKIQGNYKTGAVGDWYDVITISTTGNVSFSGKVTAPEFIGDLTGNADSATKVYSTLTEASTGTSYAIPFHTSATSGNKSLLNNAGFRLNMLNGTADTTAADGTVTEGTVGYASLYLGNATASGTAGNKYGRIMLYGSNSNYALITGNVAFTADRTITIPDASGTIALTNDANKYNYGTCSTAADTVAKVVTCSGFTSLATGAEIVVKFSNTNTAANPTLNVNSTGAKPIYYDGSAITAATSGKLYAGGYYTFRYNGTQWCVVASSPTYVYTTFTEPTSSTTYNLAFVNTSATSTYKSLRINDGIKCYVNEGTTTTDGYSVIQLGNATASGTEGNKSGYLRLYNNTGSYTIFKPGEATSTVTITLPETSGTVALTSDANKVRQSVTTTANYRPLLMGATNKTDINDIDGETTNQSYVINGLAVKPSVGELHVPGPLMVKGKTIQYTSGGTAGYYCIAQFVIKDTYFSSPIELVIGDRNAPVFTTFYIRFSHVNSNDPTVNNFRYKGAVKTAYLCKSATSTWQLWVHDSASYHTMAIMSIKCSKKDKVTITYPETYMTVDAFETAIATGGSLETNTAVSLGSEYRVAAANQWISSRNINGMSINGTANRVNYGSCSTAAATAAKTVACTGFALVTGAEITVKFTVTNSAASPTLNVNSTGAKPIYIDGSAITADTASVLASGHTFTFRYNGTQYEMVDTKYDYHVLTNPNVVTDYNISFVTPGTSSVWKQSRLNNGLRYSCRDGSTSTNGDGIARITLGNNVVSGTAGNKKGMLRLYGDQEYYGDLIASSDMTTSRIWTLPDATGTVALATVLYEGTGDVSSVTLSESALRFDILWIDTSLGAYMVNSDTNYYFYTYATTPFPSQGGTSKSIVGTVSFHVNDTSLSSVVSDIKITGSSSSVTGSSSAQTNYIKKVIGLCLG